LLAAGAVGGEGGILDGGVLFVGRGQLARECSVARFPHRC
jgi:hypothetical protein